MKGKGGNDHTKIFGILKYVNCKIFLARHILINIIFF